MSPDSETSLRDAAVAELFAPDTAVAAVAVLVAVPVALLVGPRIDAQAFLLAMTVGVSPSFMYRQLPRSDRSLPGHALWGLAITLGTLAGFLGVFLAGRQVGLAGSTASLLAFGVTFLGGVWLARQLGGGEGPALG
jgi:ABC-type thiamin/hydroxymethylpyrimidine transport system permease subunit